MAIGKRSTTMNKERTTVSHDKTPAIDKPFPLLKRFGFFVFPLMVVGLIGSLLTFRETIATTIEEFHASLEQTTAIVMATTVAKIEPKSWRQLVEGDADPVRPTLLQEMNELAIQCLSIFSEDGKLVFSGSLATTCNAPTFSAFAGVLHDGQPKLAENLVNDGFWTSLVSIKNPLGVEKLFMALSRPSRALEATIGTLSYRRAILFGSVLLLACIVAFLLVLKAQQSLDRSFATLNASRLRMQKFLSKAARQHAVMGESVATQHDAVVMVVDLRNFSGFAETATLRETTELLSNFVTIVVNAVEGNGGDVDKLLGDGVLAWFEGAQANEKAIAAAIECLRKCKDLKRLPGIGLFRGDVFAASLGVGERRDFTILGRTVNIASRLCSVSGANVITAPSDFVGLPNAMLRVEGEETVALKNHLAPMRITKHYFHET